MKAVISRAYGLDGLRCEDVDPPIPGDGEVLIQVRAAALNALDWHFMKGRPAIVRLLLGLRAPKFNRPGRDVAGRVISVGRGVMRFKVGDDVFGLCKGSLAEVACASESALVAKPPNVSFEQAAALPVAGLTALQGLRDHGRIQPGQRVLVNGAAGGVGTFAVQIAKSFGTDVTGVCGTKNVEMVGSIGADRVIDYKREDFTRSNERYDLIFDLVANHSFSACRRVLSAQGMFVLAGLGGTDGRAMVRRMGRLLTGALISRFTTQKLTFFVARLELADLVALGALAASGKVTSVIDGPYQLSDASQAIRHLANGHARGKIVVTVQDGDPRVPAL